MKSFMVNHGEEKDNRGFKKIIVVAEQGLGDTFQFCRFLSCLKDMGMQTCLFSPEKLAPILRASKVADEILVSLNQSREKVYWSPLLSLPYKLKINQKSIPLADGYLKTKKIYREKWESIFKHRKEGLLIGLHWQGNISFEETLYSRGRSMPFENFRYLKDITNAKYLSLQKGECQQDTNKEIGLDFVEGQDLFNKSMDFEDTAAAIECCDLIISTDSSVAHLAGALSKPVCLLLSYVPEWRWGLKGCKTEWYKSMTLFRQQQDGDWRSAIHDVRDFNKINTNEDTSSE